MSDYFSVTQGPTQYSVRVRCKSCFCSSYIIQKSTDGKNWEIVKISLLCIMVIDGLKKGKNYFRMAAMNGEEQSDWSEPLIWEVK